MAVAVSIPDCLVGPAAVAVSLFFLCTTVAFLILVAVGVDVDVSVKHVQAQFLSLAHVWGHGENLLPDAKVGTMAPKRKKKTGRPSRGKKSAHCSQITKHFIGEVPSDDAMLKVHIGAAGPEVDEDVYNLDDSAWRTLSSMV